MMLAMRRRFLAWVCSLFVLLATPLAALAADPPEEREVLDARLEGYPMNVTLDSGSLALTWILFGILAVVALGGLFKDARRTHLD